MPDLWMDVDTALSEVPINLFPLIDDGDFKAEETGITYNQEGLVLYWIFITTAGGYTKTLVTPTDTGGDYDWVNQGNAMYTIEMPDSGGASINNDTEGFGYFKGSCTGVLPWRGPVIGFRAAPLNDALVDGGDNLDVNVAQWLAQAVTLSTGNKPDVNIDEISDDATAALTLELFLEILNQSTGQLDNGSYDTTIDTYQSKTTIIDDDTGSADRYITIWFKNGEPITSGITSPTIQVIKIADATDLVASDDMTEIGALGLYRYDEAGNRIVAGAGYIAKTQATIGGATRTWLQPIGRDS